MEVISKMQPSFSPISKEEEKVKEIKKRGRPPKKEKEENKNENRTDSQ